MGDDQRQSLRMTRADVHELNVEPIDRSHKLGQGIQLRLRLPPVVLSRPVAYELLDLSQLVSRGATASPQCVDGGPRLPLPER